MSAKREGHRARSQASSSETPSCSPVSRSNLSASPQATRSSSAFKREALLTAAPAQQTVAAVQYLGRVLLYDPNSRPAQSRSASWLRRDAGNAALQNSTHRRDGPKPAQSLSSSCPQSLAPDLH